MKVLLIVDRKNGQHIASELSARMLHSSDDITVKDLNGVTTGDITTWIGTLTDGYFGKIHFLVNANVTAGTGVISKLQYASLMEKTDQAVLNAITPEAAGACQANATATVIKLAASQTEADDYFNDMYIVTAGTTVKSRLITDYVLSTLLVTVATTTTAVTTTETYKIFTAAQLEAVMPVYAETYEAPEVFGLLYPNVKAPLVIEQMGAMPGSPCITANADSAATTSGVSTLTDTGNFTLAAYNDGTWYVAIRSATLGAGQVKRILSNTADVLTLAEAWDTIPTGTIVYEIVDRKQIALARYFLEFAFRHLMEDPSLTKNVEAFWQMATRGLEIESTDVGTLYQDLEALQAFKDVGQTIMTAIGKGITS